MTFHLLQHEPIAQGLRRIAREQIGIALGHYADEEIPLNEKVHSLRTRCKKMRGVLRLPQPLMGEAFEVEDQRFRAAAKELAVYRDMAVCAKTAELLGQAADEDTIPQRPVSTEALERSRDILAACLVDVEGWPLELNGFCDIAPGFARTCRRCVEAWHEVLADPRDENFHQLRRRIKYHWYQVRILERLNHRQLHERREQLRQLQLLLGDAHDLWMLQCVVGASADPDTQLLENAIQRKHSLYSESTELGHKVFATSVDELVARCARWWVGWQD